VVLALLCSGTDGKDNDMQQSIGSSCNSKVQPAWLSGGNGVTTGHGESQQSTGGVMELVIASSSRGSNSIVGP